jgi:hypothetical protein
MARIAIWACCSTHILPDYVGRHAALSRPLSLSGDPENLLRIDLGKAEILSQKDSRNATYV